MNLRCEFRDPLPFFIVLLLFLPSLCVGKNTGGDANAQLSTRSASFKLSSLRRFFSSRYLEKGLVFSAILMSGFWHISPFRHMSPAALASIIQTGEHFPSPTLLGELPLYLLAVSVQQTGLLGHRHPMQLLVRPLATFVRCVLIADLFRSIVLAGSEFTLSLASLHSVPSAERRALKHGSAALALTLFVLCQSVPLLTPSEISAEQWAMVFAALRLGLEALRDVLARSPPLSMRGIARRRKEPAPVSVVDNEQFLSGVGMVCCALIALAFAVGSILIISCLPDSFKDIKLRRHAREKRQKWREFWRKKRERLLRQRSSFANPLPLPIFPADPNIMS